MRVRSVDLSYNADRNGVWGNGPRTTILELLIPTRTALYSSNL